MSESETKVEFARLRKRVSELEAAHGMRGLLPADADGEVLAEACSQAGIGVRSVQERGKEKETVTKRRVVARILRKKAGWTVERIARVMKKTERGIKKML